MTGLAAKMVSSFSISRDDQMREVDLEDPIKLTLKNIIELTSSMVKSLKKEGRKEKANQLILYVATCLHNVLIKKQDHYRTNPFTPEWVKARYYAQRAKTASKQRNQNKRRSQGEPLHYQAESTEILHQVSD